MRHTILAPVLAIALHLPVISPGAAADGPTLEVDPADGPAGMIVTIRGVGYEPDDLVYVETFPGTHRNGGTARIAAIFAKGGEFEFQVPVWNVHEGVSGPSVPGEGETWSNVAPGSWTVLAYPESWGPRTEKTIAAAPKFIFTVTATMPSTGGPPRGEGDDWRVVAGMLLVAAAALLMAATVTATRRPA
ncbi:MAG TPA: hypothetical protein VIW01_01560 [Dehalococcoidia bacterium]